MSSYGFWVSAFITYNIACCVCASTGPDLGGWGWGGGGISSGSILVVQIGDYFGSGGLVSGIPRGCLLGLHVASPFDPKSK